MRGNQSWPHIPEATVEKRSIPACAGEPPPTSSPSAGQAVYPRVCGGTICIGHMVNELEGLSPRVRGNPQPGRYAGYLVRSIPACAGEPLAVASFNTECGVYPRVCGGTAVCSSATAVNELEQVYPRVCGGTIRLDAMPCKCCVSGSIPACAGEPFAIRPQNSFQRVYPRVCGEPIRLAKNRPRPAVYPRVCGGTREF